MSIKVISADSHPVTALGMEAILRRFEGVSFVATVRCGGELAKLASAEGCDVLVTDREAASVCDDAALGPLIKLALDEFPDVGVVLHSCIRNAAYVATLSQLGVHAVLDKEDVIEHLHAAVLAAHTKANYISPTLADATMANSRAADVKPLSKCEVGVLKGVLSGQSVKQISLARYRSKQTISTHKKNAMRKLQVTTDAELFRIFSEGDFTLVEINCSGAGKQAR